MARIFSGELVNEMSFSHRGWIANEIFRRVHPEGSTIGRSKKLYFLPFKIWSIPGEFLRSKVSEPLNARAFVGVREEELADYEPGKDFFYILFYFILIYFILFYAICISIFQ